MIKFIHCADLHIDSPFKGVSDINPELADALYRSTFVSFNKIIDIALEEKADAVLIAGDVYDGENKSLKAQFKFRDGLQKLSDAGISSFIVHGNHDPLNGWAARLNWPEKVHIFQAEPECIPLVIDGNKVANIYGASYPRKEVVENLALRFPVADGSVPCIGLLHANLGANTEHENYAPCSIDDLNSRRMDYWALGHVHTHKVLGPPRYPIVYPGCAQSRSARETGAKGCCIVTMLENSAPQVKFMQTDTFRYYIYTHDISGLNSVDDVKSAIIDACCLTMQSSQGCQGIFRIILKGRTALNDDLRGGDRLSHLLGQVRDSLADNSQPVWIDRLALSTAGTYDIASLREGKDIASSIILACDEMTVPGSAEFTGLKGPLNVMLGNRAITGNVDNFTDDLIRSLAVEARDLILDKLLD